MSHVGQELVGQGLLGRCPLVGVEGQHGQQPLRKRLGDVGVPLVLFRQDQEQSPRLQLCDVTELPLLVEELAGVFSGEGDVARDGAHQLDDVCQVVLVPGVVLPTVRLKEVVSCSQLEGHAGSRPDVSLGTVPRSEEDFEAAVLPSLDVLGEVVSHPARVAQVGDLDLEIGSLLGDGIVETRRLIVGALG